MKHAQMLFIVTCSLLALSPFTANALTFTLSDDAIMALDYNNQNSYYNCGPDAHILAIRDIPGLGVQFDILFPDPYNQGPWWPALEWISSVRGGNGVLVGRDISMFDAFALKFTFLSAGGVSTTDTSGFVTVGAYLDWAYHPENITIDLPNIPVYPHPTVSAVSLTSIRGLPDDEIYAVGFTCYIPSWYYDDTSMTPPWDPCGAIVSILVEPAPGAVVLTSDPDQVLNLVSIDKCTVAAGSKAGSDKIAFSGQMNPAYDDLYFTNFIQIAVGSDDMNYPCVILIPTPINENYKKTGKYIYSGTDEYGVKKSFKLDFNTHRFSLVAQNINLSGLSCPLNVGVDISGYSADTNVDESIVNGPKKPIPINLLMGVRNSVRVDKLKVRSGKTDLLTVKGGFSAQNVDVNMAAEKLSVTLGSQTFTIPAKTFKPNKTKTRFACSNVKLYDGLDLVGIAAAAFDFNKGTFALTIKNTNIDVYPGATENFTIDFTGFTEDADVIIPYP